MRTIPGKMRTDELYVATFGSFIFINIRLHASTVKRARGRAPPCPGCGDPRVMFVDIAPPVGTRVVSAQVARGRRYGREASLGTWVCEQRMPEPNSDQQRAGDSVVARRRR